MTKDQEVLQQFINKRVELLKASEQLRLQLQQQTELLLRVEGGIEALGLLGIEPARDEDTSTVETPE